ncbi:hypothetical protein ACWDBO_53600 [Streptomyces mirabilis]|uniref:hypothetical protein n=1 Tax=Streptomyces mirabilis TaxID=68239 RepID=UPI0033245EE8
MSVQAELTHKHTGLKDLFYALVRGRAPLPETVPESARARADKQQQNLTRIRAERDDRAMLRTCGSTPEGTRRAYLPE